MGHRDPDPRAPAGGRGEVLPAAAVSAPVQPAQHLTQLAAPITQLFAACRPSYTMPKLPAHCMLHSCCIVHIQSAPVSVIQPAQRAAHKPFTSAGCPGPDVPSVPSAAGHLPRHRQSPADRGWPRRAEHQFSPEGVHQQQVPHHTWCSLCPRHPWRADGESVRSYGSCQRALMGLCLAVLCS